MGKTAITKDTTLNAHLKINLNILRSVRAVKAD